jgi:hypothetical protein
MWSTDTLWFEFAMVTLLLLLGNMFLGHFEERSPRWRKLVKYLVTLVVVISISVLFGRTIAFIVLGIALVPVFYVHGVLLPKKGINGWTGEPKSKYYEFRGWSKNIFGDDKKRPEEHVAKEKQPN